MKECKPLKWGKVGQGSREEWEEEVEQWKQVISILQEVGQCRLTR